MELLIPKLGEFIPALVAFIVLWIILAKLGWPMVTKMLDKRTETIKADLSKAEEARIESERLLEENKAQLAEAKVKAQGIISDAQKAAETVKAEIVDQAQAEANEMIAKAKAAIEAEKRAAIHELQSSAADLSVTVAGRLIGEDLSDDEHRKIIERYVAEAGSFNAN